MHVYQYHPNHFERWDWRAVDRGIGGAETCQIEMGARLAKRGHVVTNYAPIPDDCPGYDDGVTWAALEDADFSQPGLWVVYRSPETLDKFDKSADQMLWFLCQDIDYKWTDAQIEKMDMALVLCQAQARHISRKYPQLASKIRVTSNGIRSEEIQLATFPTSGRFRNPHRLMYASSPDRGWVRPSRFCWRTPLMTPQRTRWKRSRRARRNCARCRTRN